VRVVHILGDQMGGAVLVVLVGGGHLVGGAMQVALLLVLVEQVRGLEACV